MEKVKLHVWLINAETLVAGAGEDWAKPNYNFQAGDEPSDYYAKQGYLLADVIIVNVPSYTVEQLRVGAVEGLRKQKESLMAASQATLTDLEQRINDLLMIGYDSTEDHV